MTELKYTPNYCEENVWHLCQHPQLQDVTKRVLFVSSLSRNSPLQFQKSAQEDAPVWWDYHVILMTSSQKGHFIYDFDSTLPFPCEARKYLLETFQEVSTMKPEDRPLFKVIDGMEYVKGFHSDRSHMKDQSGNWIFEPPTWAPIKTTGQLSVQRLMNFSNPNEYLTLDAMMSLIS